MKKVSILIIIFIILCRMVFAAGNKQAEEVRTEINNNWILSVTALDSSALQESRRAVVDIFMRSLVDKLQTINYRLRVSPEYAYYEDYAWSRELSAAAKSLEAKQNERSLLLYQGMPEWRYKREVKRRDADIATLRETLEKKQAEKPLVNRMPEFDLTAGSKAGNFPAVPKSGGEHQFCQSQGADGFLSGTISEFYGRFYVHLKLYVMYTRSYIFESDVIFSSDDIEEAVDDIASRLMLVLSGNRPAAIAIRADPPDTLVLVNQSFAGRGGTEAVERPPGKVIVAFSKDGYNSDLVETELFSDELTEIIVSLSPVVKGEAEITVPGQPVASVYHGSLYLGQAPLSLWLPLRQLDYINILTPNGEEARSVFFTPEFIDMRVTVPLATKLFPDSSERRVNTSRNRYYWTWGGVWFAIIGAWVSSGLYTGYSNAYYVSGNPDLYSQLQAMDVVRWGSIGLVGAVLGYNFYELYRYIDSATENAPPIVKTEIKN